MSARKVTWLLLLVCVSLRIVALLRTSALSDDEAIYAVVGREMIAGQVLYRDVVDHKPPLIYVTYATTQAIGGPRGGMFLVHALTVLVVFGTSLVLRRILRRHAHADEHTAGLAALLWIVFTTTMMDFDSLAANCELYMVLFLALSVATYLAAIASPSPSLGWLLATGGLVGVAMLYKYQAAIHLPLYALHLGWTRRRTLGAVLVGWISIGVGFALVLALALVVLWRAAALPAALFWFKFNFAYIQSGMDPVEVLSRAAERISFVVISAALLYALGLRGAYRALARRGEEAAPFYRFACGWLLVSALAVCVGGRFFGHYFHQVTAVLAVLAAPGAMALLRRRPTALVAGLAIPAAAFLCAGVFHDRVMNAIGQPDPDYVHMAQVIDASATPGEGVCIWGNLPVLYFEAERPLGCRFPFANYLTGMSPATSTQYDPKVDATMNIVPEAWTMLETDFAARRPRIVIDASFADIGNYGKFPPAHYPRLSSILARDYHEIAIVEGVRVLERSAP
ncbi:MAG: glycosyltransferase family 39 protein [Myxococcales bacterium]|nr:glycosyltransferase family 39 protein [Myxococcales bacterium]